MQNAQVGLAPTPALRKQQPPLICPPGQSDITPPAELETDIQKRGAPCWVAGGLLLGQCSSDSVLVLCSGLSLLLIGKPLTCSG